MKLDTLNGISVIVYLFIFHKSGYRTCSIMKLSPLIFQNRLRSQLLLAEITDNNFLGERLRRWLSEPYAISPPFSHEIRFSTGEREMRPPEKRAPYARRTGYNTNSVQCPCFFDIAFGTVERCSGCCGSPRVVTEFRDRTARRGERNEVATRPLSVGSVRALTPCNYLLHVIFFNHRRPRRSAFTLTDSCRKDSAARDTPAKHMRYSPGGVEDKEGLYRVRDGGADTGGKRSGAKSRRNVEPERTAIVAS